MILVGDIHGDMSLLNQAIEAARPDEMIVQLGDFSVDRNLARDFGRPVHFIDGNHEWNFPELMACDEVTEIRPNLHYVPRGTVMEVEGHKVGFLGGGSSIDRAFRRKGVSWFAEEVPKAGQVQALIDNAAGQLDVLLTHAPPESFVKAHWPGLNLAEWRLPPDWVDQAARRVQDAWIRTGRPKLYCGHMHGAKTDGTVRVLDIGEILSLGPDYGEAAA